MAVMASIRVGGGITRSAGEPSGATAEVSQPVRTKTVQIALSADCD